MTLKELLLIIEQELHHSEEVVDNQCLEKILQNSTMHERDWRNRADLDQLSDIYFEYGTADSFDIRQLDKELEVGFYVYSYTTCLDDILITHFDNKIKAFNYFRKLSQDTLVLDRLLIDTSRGIIAGGKRIGDTFKQNQYKLYRAWITEKYPVGTKVKVLQVCSSNKSYFAFIDRNEMVGKIGKVIQQDLSCTLTIDFGEEGLGYIEVGKDQIKIL